MDPAGDKGPVAAPEESSVAVLIGGEATAHIPAAGCCQRKGSQCFKGNLKGQQLSDSMEIQGPTREASMCLEFRNG